MTVDEFEKFISNAGLLNDLLTFRDLGLCFNLSMMTQVNEVENNRHLQANFLEFMEAVARVVD